MNLITPINVLSLVISSAFLFTATNTQAVRTSLVTNSLQNQASFGTLYLSALSADGRYVVFSSKAEDLVVGDTAFASDIFLHDRNKHKTIRISVNPDGEEGNASSQEATISANGRFVAFSSAASNIVLGDTNNKTDVFVFNQATKKTSCISCNSPELLLNSDSSSPSMSADGRFVAFVSKGWNGSSYQSDIFVHDRQQNKTTKVSVSSAGIEGDSDSGEPFISANGRFVAFSSWASNLVPKVSDTYYEHHIFIRDLQENKTTRVSVNTDGLPVDAFSFSTSPALSASGRFVVFASRAANLVPNDTNYATDIFVNDQLTGKTKRISVDSSGDEGNGNSHFIELENPWLTDTGICACFTLFDPFAIGSGAPAISADGRFLAFDSYATNLVAADMNTSQDVFLHDQNTGKTTRVSVDSRGKEASLGSGFPSLSADGRTLVFASKGAIMHVQYSVFNPVERIYAKDLYVNSGKICHFATTTGKQNICKKNN